MRLWTGKLYLHWIDVKGMDMNSKEKEKIYEWACDAGPDIENSFTTIDKACDTYYEKRNDEQYIKEYFYQTVPELKQELEALWGDSSYMKTVMQYVLVAAIKNKPRENEKSEENQEAQNAEQIKAYIYNF